MLDRACTRVHTCTACAPRLLTCSEPRHRCRGVSVTRVARPQLPLVVGTPADDASVGKYNARVVASHSEVDGSWQEMKFRNWKKSVKNGEQFSALHAFLAGAPCESPPTVVGVVLLVVSSVPSSPSALLPQQATPPSDSTTQVWYSPAAITTTPVEQFAVGDK